MVEPVIVRGIAPSNVLDVSGASTAVLLVMRRPSMVRSRHAKVRWFVWCQVALEARVNAPAGEKAQMVSVPAHPPRRFRVEPIFVADELPLAPLPAHLRAVAVAYFPVPVRLWRFEFFTDQQQDPDASAEAWAFPMHTQHTDCGFF
jgi:hypothetical protein